MAAGIAHEINNPLGAIKASVENLNEALGITLQSLPFLIEILDSKDRILFMSLLKNSLDKEHAHLSSREERKLRKRLSQALEELDIENAKEVATQCLELGITEFNDLLAYVGLFQSRHRELIFQATGSVVHQKRSGETIARAVEQASRIVFALKRYSQTDDRDEKELTDLREDMDTTLLLYSNRSKYGVTINKHYEDIPNVSCYANQLNQVWSNLIHNALQAMKYQGELDISMYCEGDSVFVAITDDGEGIAEENLDKIFDQFFTTRPTGEGSGLGLHIVKQIIDKHQGEVFVDSVPGKTTFTIRLPVGHNDVQPPTTDSPPTS